MDRKSVWVWIGAIIPTGNAWCGMGIKIYFCFFCFSFGLFVFLACCLTTANFTRPTPIKTSSFVLHFAITNKKSMSEIEDLAHSFFLFFVVLKLANGTLIKQIPKWNGEFHPNPLKSVCKHHWNPPIATSLFAIKHQFCFPQGEERGWVDCWGGLFDSERGI